MESRKGLVSLVRSPSAPDAFHGTLRIGTGFSPLSPAYFPLTTLNTLFRENQRRHGSLDAPGWIAGQLRILVRREKARGKISVQAV